MDELGTKIVSIYCRQVDGDNVEFEVVNDAIGTEFEDEANFVLKSYAAVLQKLSEKTDGLEINDIEVE